MKTLTNTITCWSKGQKLSIYILFCFAANPKQNKTMFGDVRNLEASSINMQRVYYVHDFVRETRQQNIHISTSRNMQSCCGDTPTGGENSFHQTLMCVHCVGYFLT